MKKKVLLLSALTISAIAYSQVGINTPDPKATLDVVAKNPTGTSTTAEGFLIPRVDRQRAQSMTSVGTSTMIYVNSVSTGSQTGIAAKIDAVGYYYYNGTEWTKLNSGTVANLYNADGTLTGNRVVAQTDKTLAFTGTAANAFSVDGSTFSVNAANDRIGIGTTTPTVKLHVEGAEYLNAAVTNSVTQNALDINIGEDGYSYGNRTENYGIKMKTASSVQGGDIARINFGDTATGSNNGNRYLSFSVGKTLNELMYMTDANGGNVGIGTIDPKAKLDLIGTTFGMKNSAGSGTWDNIWFNVTPQIASINASGAGSGIQFNVGDNSVGGYGEATQVLKTVATMMPAGNMGIGTKTPHASAILELSSTTQGFLPPRMTTTQRDQITTPVPAGLMVYNTTTNIMQYYNGTAWINYN